jgi:2-oxoglutarate dehydrogenase E2 component (dihydrolipoamide succinyltransferase)
MGDSITEGALVKWLKNKGDYVALDEILLVIETDKVAVDVRAPTAGILEETMAKVGDTVAVGAPLAKIRPAPAPAGAAAAPAAPPAAGKTADATPAPAAPAPAPKVAAPAPVAAPKAAAATEPAKAGSRDETRVKMTRMRLRIAQRCVGARCAFLFRGRAGRALFSHLVSLPAPRSPPTPSPRVRRLKDSQNTTAMLTTFQECDMTGIMELREKYKDAFEKKHGVKLGFMSAFLSASAAMLKEIPVVNAVIEGGDIVYRDYVDLSVAVSSPRGLVVPVLRNAETMSFKDFEVKLAELAVKARADQIAIEDMTGGTFTISNGGVFGSMMGTPIINPPQSAILGMHATKMRPTVVNVRLPSRSRCMPCLWSHPPPLFPPFAGQSRDSPNHVPCAHVRSPPRGRTGGCDVPLRRPRQGRGPAAAVSGALK